MKGRVAAAKTGTIPGLGVPGSGPPATFPFDTLAAALQEDAGVYLEYGYIGIAPIQNCTHRVEYFF